MKEARWPGRRSLDERAAAEGCTLIDWEAAPFTPGEAEAIRSALAAMTGDGARSDRVTSLFLQIRTAAERFTAAREHAVVPVLPDLDWRRGLRRLRKHPHGLTRLLGDERYHELLQIGVRRAQDPFRPPRDWQRRLLRDPDLLIRAIDSLIGDPFLAMAAGREPDLAMSAFVAGLARIYEAAAGRRPGRSVSTVDGKAGGAAVRFIRACVEPFDENITDEAVAARIRPARRRAGART